MRDHHSLSARSRLAFVALGAALLIAPWSGIAAAQMDDEAITFAVIGDYGSGWSGEAAVAAMVHEWEPDFIITTGDNNYPDGAAETIDEHIGQFYADYIGNYRGAYGPGSEENRFFPSLGNHDWYAEDAQPYLDYFTLPGNERYYDFVWGPVHFFAVDNLPTEPDGFRADSIQAEWLREALAESTAPWRVVYMHVAPYSSGAYESNSAFQWPFADWGASVVLAGHDHIYERLEVDGIPYLVNGLGGGAIYEFDEPLPETQARYNASHGALRVTADAETMTFEFFAVDDPTTPVDVYTLAVPEEEAVG